MYHQNSNFQQRNNFNYQGNGMSHRIPNRIYVGGIPQTASQDELRDYFSNFGMVKDARIITDQVGNSRGFGFVTYNSEDDAMRVLTLKEEDLIFKESKLNVNQAYRNHNNNNNNNMHHHHQQYQQQQQHGSYHQNQHLGGQSHFQNGSTGGFGGYAGNAHFGGANMRYGQ